MKLILALALALTMAALASCNQHSTTGEPKPGKGHNWDRVYDPTNGTTTTETSYGGQ